MSVETPVPTAEMSDLPLNDNADADYERLWQEFWNERYDKLTLVYQPQRLDPALRLKLQRLASQNATYCLTLIAFAHLANIKDSFRHPSIDNDELTDMIYSELVQITREKIDSFEIAETDILLLAITALCMYDMMLDRHEALNAHQRGMNALVASRGGVHNLGLSLPYVVGMDRLLALRTNSRPQYAPLEIDETNAMLRQPVIENSKGSAFRTTADQTLAPAVTSVCYDAAQLLTIMDELHVNFDPSRQSEVTGSRLDYFRFLREELDGRHTVLNHLHLQDNGSTMNKNSLALTATKIVSYYLASDNYLPFVTDSWAARLWSTLTRASSDGHLSQSIMLDEWTEDMPFLLWLLFACALPGVRERNLSFSARLKLESGPGKQSGSRGRGPLGTNRNIPSIVSPSSPVRHRHLPQLILHVAEHLFGERPLSGTADWDREVNNVLVDHVWNSQRLHAEYTRIIERVDENVLIRAENEA